MPMPDRSLARTLLTNVVACLAVLIAGPAIAQQDEVPLSVLPVQGNVYMLHGGDAGNIAFQVGSDGVLRAIIQVADGA